MNAKDIKVGRVYAASRWGKPKMGTSLVRVRVAKKLYTPPGKQQQFQVVMIGLLNRDWEVRKPSTESRYTLKSGNFFDTWPGFWQRSAEKRKAARDWAKEREQEEKEKKKQQVRRREIAVRIKELTGVAVADIDRPEAYNYQRTYTTVKWDHLEDLLKVLEEQKKQMEGANSSAMDLLNDIL